MSDSDARRLAGTQLGAVFSLGDVRDASEQTVEQVVWKRHLVEAGELTARIKRSCEEEERDSQGGRHLERGKEMGMVSLFLWCLRINSRERCFYRSLKYLSYMCARTGSF